VIPKYHGEKLADIPDDQLGEILVRVPHQPIGKYGFLVNGRGKERK
jgi:hypothetical protein